MDSKFCFCWKGDEQNEHDGDCPALASNCALAAGEWERGADDAWKGRWLPPSEGLVYRYYVAGYHSLSWEIEDQLKNL